MPTLNNLADIQFESLRLHKLCSSKDEAQRDQGYAQLQDRLMRTARRLVRRNGNRGGDYLAEESCANAMSRIYQRLLQCRDPRCFLAWCVQIVRREFWTLQKRASRYEGRLTESDRQHRTQTSHVELKSVAIDAPMEEGSQTPREEITRDASIDVEHDIASRDWIRWVLQRIADSPHLSDHSKQVLVKGYLCDMDDESLALDLHTTRKNITVIRARDRANLRHGDPELLAQIRP